MGGEIQRVPLPAAHCIPTKISISLLVSICFQDYVEFEIAPISTMLRNLEHSHDVSQTFGHPKSHTLGQPAKGQS